MNEIYEIRIDGQDITIPYEIWDDIRAHVRENKWFYLEYNCRRYIYVHDKIFSDRPARFDFKQVNRMKNHVIDIITI